MFGANDEGPTPDGSYEFQPPIIDISKYMPDKGRLGYYVRARGVSNVQLITVTGDLLTAPNAVSGYYMTTPLDDFTGQVFYDADFIGMGGAYSWSKPEDKPTALLLDPPQGASKTQPILSLYEVDCVIPFVVAE